MNYILGSGLVGLIARDILGPDWTIIPFYKSRFFTFNPSLSDNFIIRHSELDSYIKKLTGASNVYPYKRAYSINGSLYGKHDDGICADWMHKTFGLDSSDHIKAYMRNTMEFSVYDVRANQLYDSLLNKYMPDIKKGIALGSLQKIRDHKLIFEKQSVDYDRIISTLPLDATALACGYDLGLKKKEAHFVHLHTTHLDFEGYNQVMVVDKVFPFYQVTNVAEDRYMFYFHEPLETPGAFFMSFLKDFDILDGTSVKDYLVLGDLPKLDVLEKLNVFSVGSYAQWDWCMDIGSCVLRILKYAGRDFKEQKPSLVL